MAHFAQLNDDNIVINVIKIADEQILDKNGNESEELGIKLCQSHFPGTKWVQTSYNHNFRKSFARIGGIYLEEHDAFTGSSPFPSWVYDPEDNGWHPPIEFDHSVLTEGQIPRWNEDTKSWDIITLDKPEYPDEVLEKYDIVWKLGGFWNLEEKSSVGVTTTT